MARANTKRQSYTTTEKLKVIQFAEQHGNRSAQREFDIAKRSIRLWRRSKENLEKMPRLERANRGKKAARLRLKQDVMAWITEKHNDGLAMLPTMIRLKALELSRDPQYDIPAGQFKASSHWCQRFMKRNGLSLRQKTMLSQHLPPDYEKKVVQFHQYVITQRQVHNYPLHLVGNMDEVPVQSDMPSNRTVNAVGDKTVKIRTTGNEKNYLTVVLACGGDGSKLKRLVIFKRKTMPKI